MSTRSHPPRILNWLFLDPVNKTSRVFCLEVPGHPPDPRIGQLEWVDVIEKKFRFRAEEQTMGFWTPTLPIPLDDVGENWNKKHPSIEEVSRTKWQPAKCLNAILGEIWDPDLVHIIITAEESVDDQSLAGALQRMNVNVGPESPLQAIRDRFLKAKTPISPSPSTAATSKEYARLQKNSTTVTYDGFYARKTEGRPTLVTIAPPIQLFHPVFQEFLDRIQDPTFKPEKEVVSAVSDLMPIVTEICPSEQVALERLRPVISRLLDRFVGSVPSVGTRTADAVVPKIQNQDMVPLLCMEYKRAFGEGGCDPSTQASFSIREFFTMKKFEPLLEKSCCPVFLLAGGGPYLSILGAVLTDKFVVQRLTDLKWVGEATTHEDGRVYHLARMFASLRLALTTLDNYYTGVLRSPAPDPALPPPGFFPYPTSFEVRPDEPDTRPKQIKFKYIDALRADPTNVTFLAEAKSPDRKLVIKFVDRYGAEAHRLLAGSRMAPKLLYCGSLNGKNDVAADDSPPQHHTNTGGLYLGPMRMVVMEHIDGKTAKSSPPEDAREQVEQVLKKLHDKDLVFGDLREPNVMFSGGKAFFIDFDWAGKVGEAHYPRNLSRGVVWPGKAGDLEMTPILKDHDLFMLNKLFPARG